MTNPSDSAPDRAPRPLPDGVVTAVGLVVVVLFLIWDTRDAGSSETDWLPGSMLLVGLSLFLVLAGGGDVRRMPRTGVVALASLGGLAIWALVSIAWADVQADAWTGANRMFLYLAAFSLFALLPWRAQSATIVLHTYVLGTSAVALVAVEQAVSGADRFIDGRLSYPTGYPNANAALFLSAFWIALVLATRRPLPLVVRVTAGAAAAFLPQAAMLSQSRGSLVAFPLTGVALLVLLPGRVRTAVGIATAAAIVALTWNTHMAVFDAAFVDHGVAATIAHSEKLMAATSLVAALATLAWALLDRRVEISPHGKRLLDRAARIATAVVAVALVVGVLASGPVRRVEQAWSDFTAVDATDASRPHFSLGIGSNRYDFWRVALARFEDRPITGIGSDNFAVDYVRERRSIEEPAYPHSLPVMVLSQLGLVGAALFGCFVAGAGIAAVPRAGSDAAAVALGGAAVAGSLYFFVHACVDWFWEVPALAGPAVALLGLAISLRASTSSRAVVHVPRRWIAAGAAVALLLVASSALPWLAERRVDRALATWRSDPPAAYDLLESARALNPLSAKPDLVAGVIAARLDDRRRMPLLFARSLERNPHSWYAQLELGLAESVTGHQETAIAAVRRAIELNPREPLLQDVVRRLRKGEVIAPSSLDSLFLERIEARTR